MKLSSPRLKLFSIRLPALLSLASQRAEFVVLEWFDIRWLQELVEYWKEHERGALPGLIEFTVIIFIASKFEFVGMTHDLMI